MKDGAVIVRAPARSSMKDIEAFVERSRPWIEKHLRLQEEMKIKQEASGLKKLTREELEPYSRQGCLLCP